MRRLTTEEFIERSKLIHGDKYGYREVVYVNNKTDVLLKCNSCGKKFKIRPRRHLDGYGCQCQLTITRWNRESFIQKATELWGGRYVYDQLTDDAWHGMDVPVPIVCPDHGVFMQTPESHLYGKGCRRCFDERHKSAICGVGINDYGGKVRSKGELMDSYKYWVRMIKRCYDERELAKRPSYKDCSVCDEWLLFSNFKKWFDDPANGYKKGYQLDKDILCEGNRVYSPETCCFVPCVLNNQFRAKVWADNGLSAGVYYREETKKYYSAFMFDNKQTFLGTFDTENEASQAYILAKEKSIHDYAQKMFNDGNITEKVYNALMKYKCKS